MKKLAAVPLAAGALLAVAAPAQAALAAPVHPTPGTVRPAVVYCTYKVNADILNVHSQAKQSSSVIDKYTLNSIVTAQQNSTYDAASGYYFRYGAKAGHGNGWMATVYLTKTSASCFT